MSLITSLFLFIYSSYYWRDIRNNRVDIFEGTVYEKETNQGEMPLYFIKIGSVEHQVNASQYLKVDPGDIVKIRKAPLSKKVLEIKRISSGRTVASGCNVLRRRTRCY